MSTAKVQKPNPARIEPYRRITGARCDRCNSTGKPVLVHWVPAADGPSDEQRTLCARCIAAEAGLLIRGPGPDTTPLTDTAVGGCYRCPRYDVTIWRGMDEHRASLWLCQECRDRPLVTASMNGSEQAWAEVMAGGRLAAGLREGQARSGGQQHSSSYGQP